MIENDWFDYADEIKRRIDIGWIPPKEITIYNMLSELKELRKEKYGTSNKQIDRGKYKIGDLISEKRKNN